MGIRTTIAECAINKPHHQLGPSVQHDRQLVLPFLRQCQGARWIQHHRRLLQHASHSQGQTPADSRRQGTDAGAQTQAHRRLPTTLTWLPSRRVSVNPCACI